MRWGSPRSRFVETTLLPRPFMLGEEVRKGLATHYLRETKAQLPPLEHMAYNNPFDIKFPDKETMHDIVNVHFPALKKNLLAAAMESFYQVRDIPGLKKKPSTSELLDWLKLLVAEDIPPEALHTSDDKVAIPPLVGALLKNEQDVTLFEKLVFMQSRNR